MKLSKITSVLAVLGILCLALPAESLAEPNFQSTYGPLQTTNNPEIIAKGIEQGFRNFLAHIENEVWTQQDDQILELLREDIPSTLNGVRRSILEKADTFATQSEALARALYANQSQYPQPRDWTLASVYGGLIAIDVAVKTQSLQPDKLDILLTEALDLNGGKFPEGSQEVDQQFWLNLVIYALNNAH